MFKGSELRFKGSELMFKAFEHTFKGFEYTFKKYEHSFLLRIRTFFYSNVSHPSSVQLIFF